VRFDNISDRAKVPTIGEFAPIQAPTNPSPDRSPSNKISCSINPKIMKKRLIPLLMLAPIALAAFQVKGAIAKPAAIFDPVINKIKDRMPRNWVVRLPSNIIFKSRDGESLDLYTSSDGVFFIEESQEFFVRFDGYPNCQSRSCQFGSVVSSRGENDKTYAHMLLSRPIFSMADLKKLREIRQKPVEKWTEAERQHFGKGEQAILRRDPITLAPGLKGTFVANRGMGASTPPGISVVWKQDGFTFRISIRGGVDDSKNVSQQLKTPLINAAISMAKEQPITSRK
jgi:hypothetical protein